MLPLMTEAMPRTVANRTITICSVHLPAARPAPVPLAARDAHIVLAVRNLDKGHQAAGALTGHIEVRQVDLH